MHNGGAGRTSRAKGYPSQAFVDLDNPHDNEAGGPSSSGGRRRGKEPMVEDTPFDLAQDIGMGVNLGSTRKGSSGKKSSKQTKSTMVASKQALYDELREMAKARKDILLRRSQSDMSSTQQHSTAKSALPMDRALDLLDELQHDVSDEVYVAAIVALMDEQLQAAWIRDKRTQIDLAKKAEAPTLTGRMRLQYVVFLLNFEGNLCLFCILGIRYETIILGCNVLFCFHLTLRTNYVSVMYFRY